jgi:hypothetical protein
MGNATQEWKGTSDGGDASFHAWVIANPDATTGPYGTSMYKVSASSYDLDGDLLVNQTYTGLNGDDGVLITGYGYTGANVQQTTFNQYDWRDREVGTLAPNGVATISTLDNLSEVTETQTYADASDDGVIEYSSGDLRAQTVSEYDSQGSVYESLVYNVAPEYSTSPSPGTVGDYLPTDTWRDANGNVLATRTGTGPIEKSLYNGAGEQVESYTVAETTATADLTYAEATALQSGDIVVQQDQTWYDGDGSTIASADYQRLPGDTTTAGALTPMVSYVTASVSFYDRAGRDIEDVNYGRQDVVAGSATAFFAYPSGDLIATGGNPSVAEGSPPAPDSSAGYMVSQTAYIDTAATGPIVSTTDNAGTVTQVQADLLGRTVRTIQNYVSAGLASNGLPTASDTAEDVTTDSLYDTAGRAAATVAYDATSSSLVPETTVELYESPVNPSLQTNEIDPDSTDNAAAVSVTLAQTGGVATATTSSAARWRHLGGRQHVVHQPRGDGAARHAVVLGGFGVLRHHHAPFALDRPHSLRAIAAGAGEHDADRPLVLILSQRPEEEVNRQAMAARRDRFQ